MTKYPQVRRERSCRSALRAGEDERASEKCLRFQDFNAFAECANDLS